MERRLSVVETTIHAMTFRLRSMPKNTLKISCFLLTASFIFLLTTCSGSSPQHIFKKESSYFMALHAADQNDGLNAMRLFKEGLGKGNDITRRRCAEALTQLGNVRERVEASKYLVSQWNDDNALLVACTELSRNAEYSLIILYTEHIDILGAPNELVKLRLDAMLQKNDSRFENDLFFWMMGRALSSDHLEMYEKYLNFIAESKRQNSEEIPEETVQLGFSENSPIKPISLDGQEEELDLTLNQTLMDYRVTVFRKRYYAAFNQIMSVFGLCKAEGVEIPPLLVSDMGKASLYGTTDYYAAALQFDRIARQLEGEAQFFAYFYAGRLFDKTGRYPGQAISRFKYAMDATQIESRYDNALWYLLNTQLRTSTNDIIASLKAYCNTMHEKSYFDDFFESLSVLLLSHQQWQDFYNVWQIIDGKSSEETFCKYAYIAGRLLEDGLIKNETGLQTREAVAAFTRVLSGGSDLYYKVLALERLNVRDKDFIETTLCAPVSERTIQVNPDADRLLGGYAAFGFPQKIYSEWLAHRSQMSIEASMQASQFLNGCGTYNKNFHVQSLRIAARTKNSATEKIPHKLLELSFPRFYNDLVEAACKENDLEESLLYALIRSESFFDAEISSSVGAQGLTQLMESTAADIARKLKIPNYNILDPAINVRLGAFYLKELIERSDSAEALALFAYNAGLTNVREWVRIAKRDWSATGKKAHQPTGISMDLFLETLPYAETREYGRKVISAAAMYNWLYYNKTPADTVRELMTND